MKNKTLISFLVCPFVATAQTKYFPDATWLSKPAEMKLNKTLLDSAVNFALNNENKVERDLQLPIKSPTRTRL
jgi:hypothetical protein